MNAANSVYFGYGCLSEPPVTITILAIILLAIYVAAGSIGSVKLEV